MNCTFRRQAAAKLTGNLGGEPRIYISNISLNKLFQYNEEIYGGDYDQPKLRIAKIAQTSARHFRSAGASLHCWRRTEAQCAAIVKALRRVLRKPTDVRHSTQH